MFGYVHADTPYLYIKDDKLYKAMYCGLCKGIAKSCGQIARFGLSYDITFLSIIFHNIAGVDVKIEKQRCASHCIKSRLMAQPDELTKLLGAFNTALVYYKCTDDIADGDHGKMKRLFFKKGFNKVKKNYPQVAKIVKDNMLAQEKTEKTNTDSIDRASDATANMLAEFSSYALGDKATEYTHNLFYTVGKWIYLIDALDDYDKDVKKGAYNPFVLAYKAPSRQKLISSELGKDIEFIFNALFFDIRENLAKIKFYFNRDLTDNILLRGLPATTKRVMTGNVCKITRRDRKPQTTDNK